MNYKKISELEISSNDERKSILLPDGFLIPLPPRSMWKGNAHCLVQQPEINYDRPGIPRDAKAYVVTLSHRGTRWGEVAKTQGIKQVIGRGVGAVALEVVGIAAARVIGGVIAGIVMPSKITSDEVWRTTVPPHTQVEVWMIGFK